MKKSVRYFILGGVALTLGFLTGFILAPAVFETPEFISSIGGASAPVAVPNVIGMSRQDAQRTIESTNLILAAQWSEYGDLETMGTVSRQDPPAGALTPHGGSVNIFWNVGPMYREYHPEQLLGMTAENAESMVADWQLYSIGRSFVPHPRVPEGIVIGVSPWETDSLSVETPVRILVSTGWSGIPYFIGMDKIDAIEIATDMRLFIQIEYTATARGDLLGKILQQNPAPGESFISGDTLFLQVGIVDEDWGIDWE